MAPDLASKTPILVVDDENVARSALSELLRDEGYDVHAAADGFKALGRIESWTPEVVITDLKMPGMDGMELMAKLRERLPGVSVIVMTAFGSVEGAVAAMQAGADDFLTKPIQLNHLLIVLARVLDHRRVRREADRLRSALETQQASDQAGLVGRSKAFRETVELGRQVAGSDASIMIVGEAGTGKKRMAAAIHGWSRRAAGPFVTVNCAMAEDALDAELFGRPAGSAEGCLAQARGGTLFLDDVGSMPPAIQVKLRQYLYDRWDVGTAEAPPVRVISAATDLQHEVATGRFREDLYYRLNVVTLRLPALRERREDILQLANHFLRTYVRKAAKGIDGFTDRALGVLFNFDWPGNIRQLETCVQRAVALCGESEIQPRHFPQELLGGGHGGDTVPRIPGSSLRDIERYAILRTLEHVGGSTSKAARILGISPRKIQYRLNEYRDADPSGVPAIEAASPGK